MTQKTLLQLKQSTGCKCFPIDTLSKQYPVLIGIGHQRGVAIPEFPITYQGHFPVVLCMYTQGSNHSVAEQRVVTLFDHQNFG